MSEFWHGFWVGAGLLMWLDGMLILALVFLVKWFQKRPVKKEGK
jgi:hypothetical protein